MSKPKQEIIDFCDFFDACGDGREWALETCDSLQHAWDTAPHDYLLWIATRPGVLTDRELRLSACWCVRQVWYLLRDDRSKHAIEVAERHAIGDATDEELSAARAAALAADEAARAAAYAAARAAAYAAARAAADEAAYAAAYAAARAAARAAADEAARAAARAAARTEAYAAALAAAYAAAYAAARKTQDAYLREHCRPDFARAIAAAKEVA